MSMKDISKTYSRLELTDKDVPGLDKLKVGGKYKFEIEVEHVSTSKPETYDFPSVAPGGKKMPPQPKLRASFKIIGVDPLEAIEAGKVARY